MSSLAKFTISAGAGNLNLNTKINITSTFVYIPYTGDMAYWRIRHQSSTGMMFLETSADTKLWIERFSIAMPYLPSTARVQLYGGSYQGGPPDVEAISRWDDLVVYNSHCPRP